MLDSRPRLAAGYKHWREPMFWLGVGESFHVNVGGQLYLSEVAAVALLPSTIGKIGDMDLVLRRALAKIGLFCVLWGVGSLATELSLGAPPAGLARGIAAPFFTWLLIATLATQGSQYPKGLTSLCCGVGVAFMVGTLVQPSVDGRDNPWKFGLGFGITVLSVHISDRLRTPATRFLFIAIPLVVSFFVGSRSLACILVVVMVVMASRPKSSNVSHPGRRHTGGRLLVGCIMAALFTSVLLSAWTSLATSGRLGALSQSKAIAQAERSDSALLSARPEFLFTSMAVLESPIIGYGDAFAPKKGTLESGVELANRFGLDGEQLVPVNRTIPAHSYLMGAWVSDGILAMPFWIFALFLVTSEAVRVALHSLEGYLLPTFLAASVIWDMFFSPFGDRQRMSLACTIVLLLITKGEAFPKARANPVKAA